MPQDFEVVSGIYQHYKGDLYTVLFVATDSTNNREGKGVVVYVPLAHGTIRCRDIEEFTEIVEWPDGSRKSRFIGMFTSFKKPANRS